MTGERDRFLTSLALDLCAAMDRASWACYMDSARAILALAVEEGRREGIEEAARVVRALIGARDGHDS